MLEPLKDSPLAAFFVALVAALLLTPVARWLALRAGAVARPDERRLHSEAVAQWGGMAIFFGVALAALIWRQPTLADFRFLAPSSDLADVRETASQLHLSTVFFGCGLLMLLLGMLDDRHELKPLHKLAGQIAVVSLMWWGGVRINTLPFTAGTLPLGDVSSFFLTQLWVLGIANGINFIDGVDGLAAGLCAIAAGSLCFINLAQGALWAAVVTASISGACLGFLRYNFQPARIFLGDAGSLLLGFWLAAVALAAANKTAATTALGLPLLVLGVPVLDALWAIVRRALSGQPVWRADRGHLHHRLLARGYSPRKVVTVLYSISLILGAAAVVWATRKS